MAAINGRRLLACILYIYQRNRKQNLQRIQKILSILLCKEERRCLIQHYLIHLKNLVMVNDMIKRREQRKARSCCRFLRNKRWWETVRDNYDDKRFYETFRMSRTTFYHILDKISDQIEKQRVVEELISPDIRFAVTIYKLSCGDYIYTIGEMCGLAKATVCTIVSETCKVIVDTLWNNTVKKHFPSSSEDFKHNMDKFGEEWQFHYAFSAVDGSHLPIKCPNGGAQAMKQYFNFKGFYSIVLRHLLMLSIDLYGLLLELLEIRMILPFTIY